MGYFDADAQEMLEVYLLEARQLTEQLNKVLLDTESKDSFTEEDIHNVFRIMHTLKSSSAMMGLRDLSSLAHKMEDLFSYFREQFGRIEKAQPEMFDLLYGFSDFIENEMKQMSDEDYRPGDTQALDKAVDEYLSHASSEKETKAALEPLEETKEVAMGDAPSEMMEKPGTIVRVRFEEGCRMEHLRAFMLIRQIKGMCSDLETYPQDLEHAQEQAEYIGEYGIYVRFESEQKEAVLAALSRGLFVAGCEVIQDKLAEVDDGPKEENASERKPAPDKNQKVKAAGFLGSQETEFLNVRSDRLDKLQNLAREMIIQLMTLEMQLEENGMEEIKEGAAHQINRLVGDVEHTVMEMRMVPIERIVPKLRRILRDICRDEKKEVDFEVRCGDIEADKSVVDYISEALLHLIRNAVDHGIESPQERIAAGKDKKGKITFSVESTVGEVLIYVSDDGRGLDRNKILARAKKMGILAKPQEEYTRSEIMSLILHPGFTTKDEVTEYSGRGVGLDVVKNVLESAGGNLYIDSEMGKGSTFTLVVPLTLATMECIRFRVGEYRFSLPARYVFRFMDYRKNENGVKERNGRTYILYEGRMVPLIDLRKFYQIEGTPPEDATVIYTRGTEKEGCILVDSLYEQKRIVVKQLPALFGVDFRRRTGVSGMSIMGSGNICTALDLEIMFGLYERGNLWR